MKKENKPPENKFNIYWFYGLVIAILLGMSLFGGGENWSTVNKINVSNFEKYLNDLL